MPTSGSPRQNALRKGRFSEIHSRYFLTFCTKKESASLTNEAFLHVFSTVINQSEADGTLTSIAFTLMPDHVHLLIQLGDRLTLGQTIAKLKSLSKSRHKEANILWQSGYYDHKLRSDEEECPILHYIYMNPYREKLISTKETWSYTHFRSETRKWFEPTLDKVCPYPEWLSE